MVIFLTFLFRFLVILPVLLIFYTWIIYPVVIIFISFFGKFRRRSTGTNENIKIKERVWVSVVLSAHNEEDVIEERLLNLLECVSVLDKSLISCHVFVGIDGATDKTLWKALKVARCSTIIHIRNFERRRGKIAVLKDMIIEADKRVPEGIPHILIFTDANTVFKINTVNELIKSLLSNPDAGGVNGKLELYLPQSWPEKIEQFYWKIENILKHAESKIDSCVGANGAVFAIWRDLFWDEIPDNTIVEDFVIGVRIRQYGKRFIFIPSAVAMEKTVPFWHEYERRRRIGFGNFQALILCKEFLNIKKYNWFAFSFISRKVIRWLSPFMFFLSLAFLPFSVFFEIRSLKFSPVIFSILFIYFVIISGSIIGFLRRNNKDPFSRVFVLIWHILKLNFALMTGGIAFLLNREVLSFWKPSPRSGGCER